MFQILKTLIIKIAIICFIFTLGISIQAQRFTEIKIPSNPTVTSGTIDINLTNNEVDILDLVKFPVPRRVLSGKIFFDGNKNGIQDDNEKGLANIKVIIETETDGTYIVYTNENGEYSKELYIGEVVKIFAEIEDSLGNTTIVEVTTVGQGGVASQDFVIGENDKARPIGIFYNEEKPTPINKIVKPIIKIVRSGGVEIQIFIVLFVSLVFGLIRIYIFKKKH
jgi:SdrD B-like domain